MKYLHKPKMGDIIYSLPFIKHNGGGILYLDPVSKHFPNQKQHWEEQFKWLMPLIQHQEYIEEVKIYNGEKYDIDLDEYMNTTHLTPHDTVNIVDNHFIAQGEPLIPYQPWLTTMYKINLSKTIVANSSNHHNNVDYKKLLKISEFHFVGTETEIAAFSKRCGRKFPSCVVNNALELANIISGCETFIGNQSLPLAIALGLGKNCLVEQSPLYPNCIMGNYNKL